MNRDEILNQMNEVFQDVFEDETLEVNENTNSNDIDDWDSLEHIDLVTAVEKKFDVKFSMSEITDMKNVGEMADIIMKQQ